MGIQIKTSLGTAEVVVDFPHHTGSLGDFVSEITVTIDTGKEPVQLHTNKNELRQLMKGLDLLL